MLKVGITGGIGSGKSIVCQVFEMLGIPIFNADAAAKFLMETDNSLVANLKMAFGEAIYDKNGKLDRAALSAKVFNDAAQLNLLNALVHPATILFAAQWMEQQTSPYALKEAALLFESNSYQDLDFIIGVTAPQEIRVQRAMLRDGVAANKIFERIAMQMNEEEKMQRCDFVIQNDNKKAILPQVLAIHEKLLLTIKKDCV
ncbi:MAG TPA: dephospho-CoA kinase [Flavipsychrobacter sp.]|nr:dephospho-CoA kinase [Flavipsychrobacter sp.]